MCFDFRSYLGDSFDGRSQTVDALLTAMDAYAVSQTLVMPFKPQQYMLDPVNNWLGNLVRQHNDRLVGAARIDPWQPDALEHLTRAVEIYGLKALYLDPWEESFRIDMPQLDPLVNYAQSHRLPVIIAAGFPWRSEALQALKLVLRWPQVDFVLTNGGQINISGLGQADVTLALSKASNLYIETAGVYRQDFLEETIAAFGAERVLFGSGAPNFDLAYEKKRIELLKISPAEFELVQNGNALRLIQLA